MEFKVEDEVLLKARIIAIGNINRYKVEVGIKEFYVNENYIIPARDMTVEEAWEIAKNLFADYSNIELDEIFGKGWSFPKLMELTPQQAKAKIEAWETEKEIKVGDEVDICGDKGIVTSFGTDGDALHVLYFDGIVNSYRRDKDVKKTGRHIDIDGILNQIRGTDA